MSSAKTAVLARSVLLCWHGLLLPATAETKITWQSLSNVLVPLFRWQIAADLLPVHYRPNPGSGDHRGGQQLKTDDAGSTGLRDPPIEGTTRQYLDGQWQASGRVRTFAASASCFNGSAEWLHTPSGHTPDWGTNARGLCGSCKFEENTDYEVADQSGRSDGVAASKMAYSLTPQQCCEICGADPSCTVAVWSVGHNPWTGSKVGDCMLKPAGDLRHKGYRANFTAILPTTRSGWHHITINATVPGDLVTDLQRAGAVPDPLFGTNFKNASMWSGDGWNYSTTFDILPSFAVSGSLPSDSLLVFEGVKMGATLSLNGEFLGNASDQHRRYIFSVSKLLKRTANKVEVHFDDSIDMSAGRYMSCSGGWDWAPYSNSRDPHSGLPTFTKGIWKSVYIVQSTTALITSFVPLVKYAGTDWPTSRMADGSGSFEVDVRTFLWSDQLVRGTLTVAGSWSPHAVVVPVSVPSRNETVVNVKIQAQSPKLWWARGMGAQPMYTVTACLQPEGSGLNVTALRRIGFRHLALVTVNDSDASVVAQARLLEGNGNHTLMLRLNGVPVFGKGSNMVPMELLEGRIQAGMHTQIVRSAADAGMTVLRVWGGGIYPFEEWFEACDEAGVLAMVDMMYGTDGQMPMAKSTPEQEQEYRYNVRRMAHHPSLVLYYGCNECMGEGIAVLNDFVLKIVASEDDSRPIRAASPFTGYCTGVNRLTGVPNGNILTTQYWPSCMAPPPPPMPCPKIMNRTACDPERCTWNGHCNNPPPPPPPTPSVDCSFVANIDYNSGGDAPGIPSQSPAACCDLCKASATCVVAVWVGPPGHCYEKTNASVPYKRVGGGRYACTPNKTVADFGAGGVATLHHGEEVHGPYFGGGGWPAINGGGRPFGPQLLIQIPLTLSTLGPAETGYMRTETGMTSMSSFESMSATLPENEWGLETESMHERNYPCHSGIQSYFSAGENMSLRAVGEADFKKQLYLCMLAQGIQRKAWIEAWRTSNVWGLLMWQLNEIWPTGGWGSLEYGNPNVGGQVVGGRWKILHNFMRQAAYADVYAGCGIAVDGQAGVAVANAELLGKSSLLCFVRNDTPFALSLKIAVSLVSFASGTATKLASIRFDDPAGGMSSLFCPDGVSLLGKTASSHRVCGNITALLSRSGCEPTTCFLDVQLIPNKNSSHHDVLYAHNEQLLAAPYALQLPKIKLYANVSRNADADGNIVVNVQSDRAGVAAYVWLSTLAPGRFDPNGYMMVEQLTTVKFLPFVTESMHSQKVVDGIIRSLIASVRVEHLQEHLQY